MGSKTCVLVMAVMIWVAASSPGQVEIPDDLSGVELDQLGTMVKALQKQLDECEVQLELAGQEIALLEHEAQPPHAPMSPASIDRYMDAGLALREAWICVTRTSLDLERLRAEILRRLAVLKESEPDPGQRQRVRGKLQGFKALLGELKGKVNELTTGYRQRRLVIEGLFEPLPVLLIDEPFLPGGRELDARIVQRLRRLGCDGEQLETGDLRPSDEQLDRLAGKIEEVRGREGEESRWYDADLVRRFDQALEEAGGHRDDPQSVRAAVLAMGARSWLILDSEK